ncbi:DUF2269 domain-containing protein [Paenibacillus sp. P25]|nr:DUF2269 domain-containing protein [Paenibacillus sp. P25]
MWLVFLHVLGVVLFLGNIITAAFWKIRAEIGKDLPYLHRITKNVMAADYVFTPPGIVLLLATGGALAARNGYSLAELNWLTVSLGLFVITGLLWLAVLIPSQRQMIRESAQSLQLGRLTPEYRRASRRWDVVGTVTVLIPLLILFFMVIKPF